jgi:acyl-CoA synthetase (NDP forming)
MRFIGPNCIGYINTNLSISLHASFTKGMPKPGNIALVSQSGAICLAMLEYFKARNVLSNDIDTKVMSITILYFIIGFDSIR